MILLCGIPSEPSMRLVREQLDRLQAPYVLFNQRQFADVDIEFEMIDGQMEGNIRLGESGYSLGQFEGVFTRMMDDQGLPEIRNEPAGSPHRIHCRSVHETLARWYEIAPVPVVNRAVPQTSNGSKPYQAQLIRKAGFLIPETLITNDPNLVMEFYSEQKRIIYKSISAVRSIVQEFEPQDLARLEQIRWCPTQFQAFIPGTNLRVHVMGDKVFPTAISSDATDYRYASRQTGENAELREVELSDEVAERCIALSKSLELPLAGVDLKVTPDDEVYCFEVNPSPAFSYYESSTGQPISEAIARYLIQRL
jgi:glutathione synthase/RimK-type ligase-like ATP-grasp enzyme